MDEVIFGPGSVPVAVAARVFGKDACWVRAGIITGYLNIGTATRNGKVITSIDQMNSKFGRINYYISPKPRKQSHGYSA
ncbi:hypothetical protein [Blautia massiliensis (ex Durand et al. 2017)]|uniref:hypothetical protein n=1 Tax=Blautia massiliensis (ex Durand et al. 2017) TaxID=1737424 RepID=UPI00156E024C|nr:hypothetical protein [Blautia massiliensis (ex Durand et al. 2017)]NSK83407.1 hypothetical protein [Blautia massiliensis (ex Durand et al. 2017)]